MVNKYMKRMKIEGGAILKAEIKRLIENAPAYMTFNGVTLIAYYKDEDPRELYTIFNSKLK